MECASCVNGIVNRNDPLTMNAMCQDCNGNTSYTWRLYVIRDGALPGQYNCKYRVSQKNVQCNRFDVLRMVTHSYVIFSDVINTILVYLCVKF